MLVAIQYPICDSRPLGAGASRLPVPDWPSPRTDLNPQFLRFFGPAWRRRLGANPLWFGESVYCSARRALRFERLVPGDLRSDKLAIPWCAFRRFFSDGRIAGRVEIGVGIEWEDTTSVPPTAHVLELVRDVLELPTRVRDNGSVHKGPLVGQGRTLARLYARASTPEGAEADGPARLVESSRPLVVCEFEGTFEPPRHAVRIDRGAVGGLNAAFLWLSSSLGPVGTWLIWPGDLWTSETSTRVLRLALLRLHVERETLTMVLNHLRRGYLEYSAGTPSGDELEEYLNEMTGILEKRERFSAPQAQLVEAITAAERVSYRDTNELLARLDGARRQVLRKVLRHERAGLAVRTVNVITAGQGGVVSVDQQNISGGTFFGPVTGKLVADRIENSFNTIQNSGVGEDLKSALTVLHEEVKSLADEMADRRQGDPEKLSAALETFAEQATKDKPFGEVVRAAGREIADAAQAVAERAGPIVSAVNSVLRLLNLAGLA